MRISDWSSDVCSSDLIVVPLLAGELRGERGDPARLLLEEHRMHLGGVELGAARGLGDGIVQIAEAVDQLELARGAAVPHARSEERRVGKECVSTCRSRWLQYH